MADEEEIVQKVRVEVEGENEAQSTFDKLREAFENAFEKIKQTIEGTDLDKGWEKLKESGAKAFEGLKDAATASFDKIKQTIEGTDLSKSWDKLKEIGAKAFEGLKDVATSSFGKIGSVVGQVASLISQHFLAIGAIITGFVIALGLTARAIEHFVESSLKAVNALGELADKTRTSIENVSALQTYFAQSGVSANEFAAVYRRLSSVVSETWAQIKKDAKDGSDKLVDAQFAVEQATNRLVDAQRRLAQAGSDLARQQQSDARGVEDAQNRLQDLETKQLQRLGINTSAREKSISLSREQMEIDRATQDIENARQKQQEDNEKASDERTRRQLAQAQAEQALAEARKKNLETQMNDIGTITDGVNQLASGNKAALTSFNATADNIVKGIVNSASQAGAALEGLGQDLSGLSKSSIPDTMIVLDRLGNVLNNINDPILRNQIAMKSLGNASQDFIAALQTGDLTGFVEKMKEMNNILTESDKKISSNFMSSLSRLGNTLGLIGQRMASAFGKELIGAFDSLNNAFLRSSDNLIRFADDLAQLIGLPVRAFAETFNALSQTLNTVLDVLRNILNIIERLMGMTDIPLIKSFERLYEIAKGIAQVLSGDVKKGLDTLSKEGAKERQEDQKTQEERDKRIASGTNEAPGIGDFLQRFAESAERLLDPRPLMDAITDAIKNGFSESGQEKPQTQQSDQQSDAGTTAQQTSTALQDVTTSAQSLSSTLDNVSQAGQNTQQLSDQAQATASSLSDTSSSASSTSSALQDLVSAAGSAASALSNVKGGGEVSQEEKAFATGGLIKGPGTGTSDSIVARVSDGEFVHTARATSFWGVDFMRAINNLQMPKFNAGGLVDRLQMPKFNAGGLVGLLNPTLPRFRDGGLVSVNSTPTTQHIGTVDLTTDHGVVRVVVDRGGLGQLRKAAVMRNIGSDRKPSWVR